MWTVEATLRIVFDKKGSECVHKMRSARVGHVDLQYSQSICNTAKVQCTRKACTQRSVTQPGCITRQGMQFASWYCQCSCTDIDVHIITRQGMQFCFMAEPVFMH